MELPPAAPRCLLTAVSTWPFALKLPPRQASSSWVSLVLDNQDLKHTQTRFVTGAGLCPMMNPPPQACGSPGKRGQNRSLSLSLSLSREAARNHPTVMLLFPAKKSAHCHFGLRRSFQFTKYPQTIFSNLPSQDAHLTYQLALLDQFCN